jgi:bacterioferritin
MKGDRKVIDYLNKALKLELTAVNQYFLHSRILEDWGFDRLGKKLYEESIEEMKHADILIKRILFLEGLPNLQDLDTLSIGQTVREIHEADLVGEKRAVDLYAEASIHCQSVKDVVSRQLFEDLLGDEEGHIDWLETQINLMDQLGDQNYLQLQVGDGAE